MNKNNCISCLEEIKPEAKKCPHCHQIQTILHSLNTHNKMVWGIFLVLVLLLSYTFYKRLTFDSKVRKYQTLIINNVRLASVETNLGPLITCFGHLKNSTKKKIKNIFLQAKFRAVPHY